MPSDILLNERSLYDAIYWHTTGNPSGGDALGHVVFLADELDQSYRLEPMTGHGEAEVTVQTCGDLPTIRPIVEGQPSTVFPLQTVSVPSNVNSYRQKPVIDSYGRIA